MFKISNLHSYYSDIRSRSELILIYFSKYKRRIALGIVALCIITPLDATLPLIIRGMIDNLTQSASTESLRWYALAYLTVAAILAVLRMSWRICLAGAGAGAGEDLRAAYIRCLLKASQTFFARRKIGDLSALANNDIESVRYLYDIGTIILIDAVAGFITVPLVMFYLAPKLALIVLCPLLLIPFITFYSDRRIHGYFKAVQEAFAKLTAHAQESLLGISVVKSFAKENVFLKMYSAVAKEYFKKSLGLIKVEATFGPTLELTVVAGVLLHLIVGGQAVLTGALTLGTFVAFLRYLQQLSWPMQALGLAVAVAQKALVSADRLKEVFDEVELESVLNQNTAFSHQSHDGNIVIEFKNISYSFSASAAPALRDINFQIKSGERIAIIGDVGSGKSTLLSILLGLYRPSSGQVFIQGIDLQSWNSEQLREYISFVPQDAFLFRRSISENIALGVDADAIIATQSKIEEVAINSEIHNEIELMPEGYQSQIGERGINLSGGQKQRISIARALYRKSALVVFDDALSAVDMHAEARIMRHIQQALSGHTLIFSGHRLSTVRFADRILVLKSGEIIQSGTHQELMHDRHAWYWHFYEQQRLVEELEENSSNV